ncbi:MAG TPA: preprotein translocase subunit YajC [Gemmatimonadaceae bacterium]|nr:preprotein translocase subunit YajC [Gemmatimonadaceae bacterium]
MTNIFSLALFAGSAEGGSALPLFVIQIAIIFGIFYFLMIRPQARQRKSHEERLRNLKKGDRIVTAGGIVGEVVHIRETVKDGKREPTMEDRITVRTGEAKIEVERARIARVTDAAGAEKSS